MAPIAAEPRAEVTLTEFDPDGEMKVVASALYPVSHLPDDQLLEVARRLTPDERAALLRAYVGERATAGTSRDARSSARTTASTSSPTTARSAILQRHRLLTLEWQPLSTEHGYTEPAAIEEAGALDDWRAVMDRSAALHASLRAHAAWTRPRPTPSSWRTGSGSTWT